MSYDEKISKVCEAISQNLDEDLTLERLSDVAALSQFHFHRVFSAYTGVTLFKFIQLARLKRASMQLAFKDDRRIIDIALDAGFDSPEAFSRAFKRTFGQTPSQFKKRPEWPAWHSKFQFSVPKGENTMDIDVRVVDFDETKVAVKAHRGPPDRVYETVGQFIAWRKETGLSPVKTSQTFGIGYDDPDVVKPEDFRYDVCGSIDGGVPENAYGVKSGVIPGGRCAVARHVGSLDNVADTVYYLYRDWLPNSGEELRDFPCFFHYLTLVPDVDECDLLTDIYLPLM